MIEILTKWTYKCERLANPFNILRRMICWPLIGGLAWLIYLITLIGWGKYEADDFISKM